MRRTEIEWKHALMGWELTHKPTIDRMAMVLTHNSYLIRRERLLRVAPASIMAEMTLPKQLRLERRLTPGSEVRRWQS